ncbi:serine hydrolase FSH [Chaetomium tenue]|uniref:Serine hydrolase FSH n=1 Tax=Chaetomium tenue TaxID=1854479 RepID=A0ACB7P6M0_9PEZI|nr:serine hydrolase FSH [Chaetomium globosum]
MSEPVPEPIQSAPPGKAGTRPATSKNTASLKKFRILMLHGYTQSGPSFATKTSALKKVLNTALKPRGLEAVLIYPTAPNKLSPHDLPSPGEEDKPDPEWYAWYRKDDRTGEYRYLDKGMNLIADVLREARREAREGAEAVAEGEGEQGNRDGGVDCVLGFSQGACMAVMLAAALDGSMRNSPAQHASWLENVREANGHRPLKCAVMYGGFMAAPPDLEWVYSPKVATPTLHVIGTLDTIISEEASQKLAGKCKDAQVVIHPGGHFVPLGKMWSAVVVQFISSQLTPQTTA